MSVNWVGGTAPGLNLLGDFLGVWGGEHAELGRVTEVFGEVVQKGGDSLRDTNGGQNAGAEKGVAAESVVERVLGARDVGVYPGEIRQLFQLG